MRVDSATQSKTVKIYVTARLISAWILQIKTLEQSPNHLLVYLKIRKLETIYICTATRKSGKFERLFLTDLNTFVQA